MSGVQGLRHPTQLYAIAKDLLIASVCFRCLQATSVNTLQTGRVSALFLLMYAVLRFIVESFREQPYGVTPVFGLLLSRGQLLTIPLFALGLFLWKMKSSRPSQM